MTEYRKLKLMSEVQCWAIWNMDDVGNIDPSDLPLSKALVDDLNEWSDRYDTIYKLHEPNFHVDISFASKEEEDRFYNDGWSLLARLKLEMPSVEWWYKDDRYDGFLSEKPSA